MNTSKALNILLAIALVILSIKVVFFTSHAASPVAQKQPGKTNAATSGTGEWVAVAPDEIGRNAVSLFAQDWMALAVGKQGDMNAMTISWGSLGQLWGRPVVTVYVSSSRHTHSFMERNDYFTVTGFPGEKRPALQYIGSHSGRDDKDKITKAGLTASFTRLGNPIFEEANLAIECRIIYKSPFDAELLSPEVKQFYESRGMGIHTMYIGEIVNAWVK